MMKRNFTKFLAALALLVFIAPPLVGWGQAPVNTTLWEETWTGGAANTTPSNYDFSGTTVYGGANLTYAQSSTNTKLYAEALAGGDSPELLLSKNNQTWTISNIPTGEATEMSLNFLSNKTTFNVTSATDGITISGSGKSWTISATSSVTNFNLTIKNTGSSNARIDNIVLTVTTAGGGTPTPTLTLSDSGTGNIGNYATNMAIYRDFTVTQNNLTDDITLSATNGGSFTINDEVVTSIPASSGYSQTEVRWHFTTPAEAGPFTSEITASSGSNSASCTYLGHAYAPHNVIIAEMEHGTVEANPTSAIQGEYVTLTWTPAQGYELGELTIEDANNNPVSYTDFVTYYRFQMPDSDVTVNATFVEAGATTIVTDELTNSNTINDPNATTYTSWATTGVSGAAYSGQSAGSNNTIQLRSNNSNSGIVSTTSGGNIKKVTIDWYDGTTAGRTLNIYGSNTAYTDPTDLYNANNQGTLLGTIVKGTSTELTVSGNYAYIGIRSASGAMYLNEIDIDWAVSGTPAPSISADPVEIAYNVTSGSIMYEIENYVAGTMVATTSADWISDFTYEQVDEIGEVGFTATVNPTGIARTATVTLTYTYGDSQTATKNVTVTQTGNPNVVDNISDITEVGVQYAVRGTVVATNSRGFIIGDGTGYVYTYLNAAPTQSVGDIVSISGTTGQYGHIIQFTSSATIAEATESNYNGEPEYTVITEVPDYSEGYHLSDYFQFEGTLSKAINNNYTNYNIAVGEGTIRISYPTDDQVTALEDLLDKTVRVHGFFAGISGTTFTAMMESIEEVVAAEPSITLISNDPTFTPESPYMIEFTHESGGGSSIDQVQCENFSSPLTEDDFSILFCDAEGNELTNQTAPDWILDAPSVTSESNNLYLGVTVDVNQSATARTCYFKVGAANGTVMVYSDLVTVNQAGFVATISVNPTVVNATAAETDGTITVTYTNIDFTNAPEIHWFEDAECTIALDEAPDWIDADINNDLNVEYLIEANDGEARTAYFKVYGLDIYVQEVYSDLVTINQAEYVVDYAELPFEFDGGRAAIATTNGLTQENLGSDYNSSPKLKFDQGNQNNDDKYSTLVLKINERPGTLTFNIKGNGFSGGTFKVQTSEDGETYTDLETYTELTSTVLDESFDNLGENVRYIKWIYTEKSSGNVALGNITLAKYVEPVLVPSITVDPDMVEATAAGGDGTLSIILNNMTISTDTQLNVVYCYENGEFITNLDDMPNWLECIIMEDNEAYVVYYSVGENLGTEAQTAYFKVYGLDDNGTTEAYSNLVTITQEAGGTPVAESWVLTDLADLSANDVFVIVGTDADDDTFALPNNATSAAPAATSIMVANGMLATEPDDVLKWNISGNATDGYTFYPNGDTENWLFCNSSNNGVRVGNTNDNKTFHMDDDNYLVHNATSRILSIYINQGNPQDWRCYTNTNNNPVAISFYKKVGDEPQIASITVTPSLVEAPATETEGTLTVTYVNIAEVEDEIYFCDANGEAATYNWITADYDTDNNVYYFIEANTGGARTAYFKVYGLDAEANDVYSNLVTVTQAAAPQQYDLTVTLADHVTAIFVFDDPYGNPLINEGAAGTVQVNDGTSIKVSPEVEEGYVLQSLLINNDDVTSQMEGGAYTFTMTQNVTITATAVEAPTPVGGDYVRITSLDQLTDGSKVIFAARFDDNATEYYAMSNTSSGKPTGVLFTSATADEDEVLPASIVDEEDSYYWTVGVSADGYTFTNANGELIGYSSSTNFATGGDNTEWSIESGTSVETAMVPNYTGFVITNVNNDGRAFALNTSHNFGPYAKSNMNNNSAGNYNFYLDLFVQNEAPTPTETYTLEIAGYGDSDGGYYLIASPVASNVTPSVENGFLTDAYDLYWFDQTQDEEWRNYEAGEFDLVSGMGYLYASQEGTTLTFTGTPYDGDGSVSLVKDDEAQLKGWNLVGNPFGVPAYIDRDFYKMNPQTGAELIQSSGEIAVMQGIFVIANEDGENLTFTPEATDQSANLTLNLSQSRGAVIDRAIVRFGEGRQLPKFQLNPNSTKVYIPQGAEDFAVVRSNAQGEMPVNFKAQNNGTYTISINTENLEANYLHLIDNMTGTNIDLLQTPSYTFEAKTTDYASRFRLVFNVTGVEENTTSTEPFAFFNGSAWVISNTGDATLQVIDMMGRVLRSEQINGNTAVNINETAGIYMLRLVNGENVMVQKVVVR